MKHPQLGFTLIDLLISVSIFAILIGAGIPSLNGFIATNQADSGYRQLFTLIQFSRSQSVFYRKQVVICPSINQIDCINNWGNELIIFIDENSNKKYDDSDVLLQTYAKTNNNEKRLVHAFGSTRHLSFNYNGSAGSQNGRLTYCIQKGEKTYARQIIIAKTGRARKGDEGNALTKCKA